MTLCTSIAISTLYSALSTGCILHNKYVLAHYFPHENVLLLAQNIFCIAFIVTLGKYRTESDPVPTEFSVKNALIPRYRLYWSKGDWVVGFFYSLSVLTGMWCLYNLSVPTFSAVKKSGMFISWGIEAMSPTATTWACLPSLLLVLGGTVVQTWFDLSFSMAGIVFGLLSCGFQSLSYEIGKRMVTHGKDLWSVLMINSLVSLFVQLVYMSVRGDLYVTLQLLVALFAKDNAEALSIVTHPRGTAETLPLPAPRATPMTLALHISANCVLIMFMNFTIFLNCTVNSPLAHMVTGNVKGIVTTISGVLLFSVTLHRMGIVGIMIGFVGGVWFSWVKLKEELRKREEQRKALQPPAEGEGCEA